MSQGAAAAIEDAAVLARCLSWSNRVQLPELMSIYETIRKERAYAVQDRSALNGKVWHCEYHLFFPTRRKRASMY